MSLFKPVKENQAKGRVKKVFDDIKKSRKIKSIPNFWKYIANNPDTLERTWKNTKDIMKNGALDSKTKELIYIAVSITNSFQKKYDAVELIKTIVDFLGGKGGGGRSDLAQGGAPFSKKLDKLKSFVLGIV